MLQLYRMNQIYLPKKIIVTSIVRLRASSYLYYCIMNFLSLESFIVMYSRQCSIGLCKIPIFEALKLAEMSFLQFQSEFKLSIRICDIVVYTLLNLNN